MSYEQIIQLISQVGFPIAVATYSLLVLNKTVQRNTDVMTQIAAKLDVPVPECSTPVTPAK